MCISTNRSLVALAVLGLLGGSIVRADGLAAQVAAKLKATGAMSGYRVSVKSQEKTVFLEGSVGSARQIEAAIAAAENTPGVERVVNRLSVRSVDKGDRSAASASQNSQPLALPSSVKMLFGRELEKETGHKEQARDHAVVPVAGLGEEPAYDQGDAEESAAPVQAPAAAPKQAVATARKPRPLGSPTARPMAGRGRGSMPRTIARTGGISHQYQGDPMVISDVAVGEGGMAMPQNGHGGPGGETIVPGSERIVGGNGGYAGPGGGYAGGGMGRPLPMGAGGPGGGPGGMPMSAAAGEGPNMPGYAWPSYAASPNYAAVQYPTQYSPTAWPYIGPFYPYPQVPLGWRRVSLEWDDGWWFLDFDDDHHSRGHH